MDLRPTFRLPDCCAGHRLVHSEHVALETNAAEIARYMNAEFFSSIGGMTLAGMYSKYYSIPQT
jgi:hypothetical protein